ncbi:MAG: transposase [Pyrinomonadaceae bacterium]
MNPLKQYPILATLLSQFRLSQQKTCAALIVSLCGCAQASSFAIAARLSNLTQVEFGSALTRLYRFLRNTRFDDWLLSEQLLSVCGGRERRIVLALDWTNWQDRFSVLTASACIGSRAIPVASSACVKRELARSQNLWEETFARLIVERLQRAGVSAVWLCDRGFHRVAWLKFLASVEQRFVVRLQRDVTVHLAGKSCLLKEIKIKRGKRRDLGSIRLRSDEAVEVRLIGVWAREAKEIWWLATNIEGEVAEVVALYDRRMAIEEQFRDTKGSRFGLKLKWTQFTKAEYVERMFLLVGVALLLWTTLGAALERERPNVRLWCKRKGARLSLVRVGAYYWHTVTAKVRLTPKFIRENLPPPHIRLFKWLAAPQK